MLEKFEYGTPTTLDIECWELALAIAEEEYRYMKDTRVTPLMDTEKNLESTPAYPKKQQWKTELEYLQEQGISLYLHEFDALRENNYDFKPLWYAFPKQELLKKEKIKNDDIRMIMCTDPLFTRIGGMLDQEQNALMKTRTMRNEAQVGWSPFHGNLHRRLCRLTEGMEIIYEMDWTRYDGTIPDFVFRAARDLRFKMLHSDDRKQYKQLAKWCTDNLISKFCLMPGGDLIHIEKGNPSGQYSTSADNCFFNTILTAYEFAFHVKQETGKVPGKTSLRSCYKSICYGNDRLVACKSYVTDEGIEIAMPPPKDRTIEMYKTHFGMWVKPENVKEHVSLEGASFCGQTFTKRRNMWTGTYNADKLKASLITPVQKVETPLDLLLKMLFTAAMFDKWGRICSSMD
ncbi:ORF1b [European roller astrovirus]|nr:ORF1b [European roller astrovirus]